MSRHQVHLSQVFVAAFPGEYSDLRTVAPIKPLLLLSLLSISPYVIIIPIIVTVGMPTILPSVIIPYIYFLSFPMTASVVTSHHHLAPTHRPSQPRPGDHTPPLPPPLLPQPPPCVRVKCFVSWPGTLSTRREMERKSSHPFPFPWQIKKGTRGQLGR